MRGQADVGALKNEVYVRKTEYNEYVGVARAAGVGAMWTDPQPTEEAAKAMLPALVEKLIPGHAFDEVSGQYVPLQAKVPVSQMKPGAPAPKPVAAPVANAPAVEPSTAQPAEAASAASAVSTPDVAPALAT